MWAGCLWANFTEVQIMCSFPNQTHTSFIKSLTVLVLLSYKQKGHKRQVCFITISAVDAVSTCSVTNDYLNCKRV